MRHTIKGILAVAICLVSVLAYAENTPTTPAKTTVARPAGTPAVTVAVTPLCSVAGSVKWEKSDFTNGAFHYKGTLTFTAKEQLYGLTLGFSGSINNGTSYACTCVTCPSDANFVSPKKTVMTKGQVATYPVDCISGYGHDPKQPGQEPPIIFEQKSKASIITMKPNTPNSPTGYAQKNATCSGSFTYNN